MDEPVRVTGSQAIQSNVEAIAASIGPNWTKRQLIDRFILGSRQPPIVGSPEQVADGLMAWVEKGDVDGFNLSRTVMPECLETFIELVIPVLQERGVQADTRDRVCLVAMDGTRAAATALRAASQAAPGEPSATGKIASIDNHSVDYIKRIRVGTD